LNLLLTFLGWEDWEFWYWGILPIGLCLIATVLVHHFYWKDTQDIAAPIDDIVKTEDVKTVDDVKAVEDVKEVDAPEPAAADAPVDEEAGVKAE